jgi:hypothetical protein
LDVDLETKNEEGLTAVALARKGFTNGANKPSLLEALKSRDLELLRTIVGENDNIGKDGKFCLGAAANALKHTPFDKAKVIFDFLLSRGADFNIPANAPFAHFLIKTDRRFFL